MGRTTATVLFTDLVGSTELRARVGENAADALRRKHDRVLTDAVEAHEGRVVKGLGDGIMATFTGASDAVVAAVAIQQAIDRLNRSGKAPVPLAVRVGLSAGDVSFEDDDVHGTPVIEAARLCAAAGGSEILALEMVRWLARGSTASFIPVGQLDLKGLPEAVPAVRIEWEPVATSAIPMPNLLTDVGRIFVGREGVHGENRKPPAPWAGLVSRRPGQRRRVARVRRGHLAGCSSEQDVPASLETQNDSKVTVSMLRSAPG